MKTKSEYIAEYTSTILDLTDESAPGYKEKGDLIRTMLDLAWARGVAEGGHEVIGIFNKEMK